MTDTGDSPSGDVAPWIRHLPRGVPATYVLPDVPLSRLLDDAAQDFPTGVAVVHRGRRLTWRQIQDQVDRLATALSMEGVARGSRVAVALPRIPQTTVALFAVWRLEATAVVIDADAGADAIAAHVEGLDCITAVVEDRHCDVGDLLPGGTHVVATGPEDVLPFPRNVVATARRRLRRGVRAPDRMMDLVRRNPPVPVTATAPARPAAEVAAVFDIGGRHQSYTHRQLLAAAFHLRLWLPDVVAGSERIVTNLPAHVPIGLTAAVTAPALAAATSILVTDDDSKHVRRAVSRHDPTLMVVRTSGQVSALIPDKTPSLRVCLQDGVCDPEEVADLEERTGARVRGYWAPGESPGLVVAEPIYGLTKPLAVGIPVTDNRVRITDRRGCRAAPGERGALWAAGPQLPVRREGPVWPAAEDWLATGVVASMDADGFVTLECHAGGRSVEASPEAAH